MVNKLIIFSIFIFTIYALRSDARQIDCLEPEEILNSQAGSKEADKINESPEHPRDVDFAQHVDYVTADDKAGCSADETGRCKLNKSLQDEGEYCKSAVSLPASCKNDECDTLCSNQFDFNHSADVTGICNDRYTCMCRYQCV